MYAVVAVSNLVMPHMIGWLVRNFDSIPIDHNLRYLIRDLPTYLKKIFEKPCWILIYPEEELWFNYRKPRPLKKGAYFCAAKLNKPIISTFTELRATSRREVWQRDFYKTKSILHVLPTIYPDPHLSVGENTQKMWQTDYQQKKFAYEKYYNCKLTSDFSNEDIVGYSPRRKR